MFDLVSEDQLRRRRAQRHLLETEELARRRLAALNGVYARYGFSNERHEVAQAIAAHTSATSHTLRGPIVAFDHACNAEDQAAKAASEPFAVLYLQWERALPGEWDRFAQLGGSRWTTKDSILRLMGEHGVGLAHRDDVTQVLLAAIAGPYRAKDWRFGRVARQVDTSTLRESLTTMSLTGEQAAERARFLLSRLEDSRLSVGPRAFERWQLGAVT